MPIRSADAEAALRQILQEKVQAVRGNNQIVSRAEAATLDPFLQRADAALRAEGGAGSRVHTDALVDKAAAEAAAVWGRFNPAGTRDGLTLAKAEVAQVKAADPALGALTELALLRAGGRGNPATAVRAFVDGLDLTTRPLALPGFTRLAARVGDADRAVIPATVAKAFDDYYRVEQRDIGGVSLQRGNIAGAAVWAIVTTTDGDDSYLEFRSADGTLITAGRGQAQTMLAWDEFAGQTRLSNLLTAVVANPVAEEGLSEPVDRARAGQPPADWSGEATLESGLVRHKDIHHFLSIDTPPTLAPRLRELANAAMGDLWESLKPRLAPGDDFELGALREGKLVLGRFTRPTDGKTYEVASWRDIDNAKFVLYFTRTEAGLQLAIRQFDN